MKEAILDVTRRDVSAKSALKAVRRDGKVPAEYYGHGDQNVSLAVDVKVFSKLMKEHEGENVLVNLAFDGSHKSAIVKDVQRDPLTQSPLHIDFQAINLKEKIEVDVHIHTVGVAPGVKLSGGVLEHITREVKVSCLPTDIPKHIEVDISKLETGQQITIKDLPSVPGVDILSDPSLIVVNVVEPTAEEEAPTADAAAEAASAAPEVIAKGKKPEEGAEEADAAKK